MPRGYDTTRVIAAASKSRRDKKTGESLWRTSLSRRALMIRDLNPRRCRQIIARLMTVVRRGTDSDAIQAAKVLLDHIAGKPPTATNMADRVDAARSNTSSAVANQIVLQLFADDPAGQKRRGRKPVYRAGGDRLRLSMPEVIPGMGSIAATQPGATAGPLEASVPGDLAEAQEAQAEA